MNDIDSKAYGESWYAATMMEAPARPPLAFDTDVDVCVIGGGLAGLTTAREIARRGWSVVLLEAGRIAQSGSGRNTGFVLPGFGADADRLVARIGFDRAKDLWSLAQAGLDYVRDTMRAERATGMESQNGWLYVSKKDNSDEFLNYVGVLGELGCEIEGWPTERVRATLRSERYFYGINYLKAFTLHPLNYALALAAAAERDGVRIFEQTRALSIDPSGVRKRIVTPGARLRANHVVLCGNVELGQLMPQLAATLLPMTTYVITTAPLGERLLQAVGYRGAVSDSELADNHYRVVGGDRLMLSGRATTWARNPRRYVRALMADIKRTYPQLGSVTADYAWSGTLGITIHRMPQIGELGPGVWLASGFGGHGLNTTAMAGNIIARAIVEGDQTWRQFTPFELVWAGGMFGRAAAQMRVWIKRLRDRIEERRAKAREAARRQAEEAELIRSAQQSAREREAAARETPPVASAPEAALPPEVDSIAPAEPMPPTESIMPSPADVDGVEPTKPGASPPKRRSRRRPKEIAHEGNAPHSKP